ENNLIHPVVVCIQKLDTLAERRAQRNVAKLLRRRIGLAVGFRTENIERQCKARGTRVQRFGISESPNRDSIVEGIYELESAQEILHSVLDRPALVVIPVVLSRCCGWLDGIRLAAKRHQLLRRIDAKQRLRRTCRSRRYQYRSGNRVAR